jgi:hypothetical protein
MFWMYSKMQKILDDGMHSMDNNRTLMGAICTVLHLRWERSKKWRHVVHQFGASMVINGECSDQGMLVNV